MTSIDGRSIFHLIHSIGRQSHVTASTDFVEKKGHSQSALLHPEFVIQLQMFFQNQHAQLRSPLS
ncbi:hypothetical protein [Candidatus Hakubella thermalkaliphila]|uniref:hypothetical protein n=1 Tax=Candidatus Hakubella thermalkaliphila TaxID=2754717 RepID=UPI0015938834